MRAAPPRPDSSNDVDISFANFPPALETVADALRDGGSKLEQMVEEWRRRAHELNDVVLRGPPTDSRPLEEYWHWLSASERLTRCVNFCDNADVAAVVDLVRRSGPEGEEIATRWSAVVQTVKRAQRESNSNASCLSVAETPLRKIQDCEELKCGRLPNVVRSLMRTLQRIQATSAYFKDERMTLLSRRVLRTLIAQATDYLPGAYEVAAPRVGLGESFFMAGQFRDAFASFLEGCVLPLIDRPDSSRTHLCPSALAENAQDISGGRRCSRSTGQTCSRLRNPSPLTQRSSPIGSARRRCENDDVGGGWWRAAVQASRDHAEHAVEVCDRVAKILQHWGGFADVLPTMPDDLRYEAESFRELHSGVKIGASASELLDIHHRVASIAVLRSVEERLALLASKSVGSNLHLPTKPNSLRRECDSTEILSLDDNPANAVLVCTRSIQDDLVRLGEIMDRQVGLLHSRIAPLANGVEEDNAATSSAAELETAMEIAKRSSWYREPPPVSQALSSDAAEDGTPICWIEVNTKVSQRVITRCPSRPRTAHPLMTVTASLPTSAVPPSQPRSAGAPRRPLVTVAANTPAQANDGLCSLSHESGNEQEQRFPYDADDVQKDCVANDSENDVLSPGGAAVTWKIA